MNRRCDIFIVLALMVLLLNGCTPVVPMERSGVSPVGVSILKIPYEADVERVISKSIEKAKISEVFTGDISGIVVPHHLLMAPTLADLFSGLKDINPDIIVVLSPNHSSYIERSVYTTTLPLETFGGLMTISPITQTLVDRCQVFRADDIMSHEYGLTNLLPYIQAAGWTGEIIPLVTARKTSTQQMDLIGQTLLNEADGKKVFFIASIDFSHGLKAVESRSRDAETIEWIKTRAYNDILGSGPEYMDNPSGLYIWLQAMSSTHLVFHGESGSLSGERLNESGTSYLIYTGVSN